MILELSNRKQSNINLENLLMIVPVIVLILANLLLKSAHIDSNYSSTYFSFSFGNVAFLSWALLILPFVLHLFLKQQQVGSQSIISLHIVGSLILLVSVLFTYELFTPTNAVANGSYWGVPVAHQWLEATFLTYTLLLLQFFLQIVFCAYALIKLIL